MLITPDAVKDQLRTAFEVLFDGIEAPHGFKPVPFKSADTPNDIRQVVFKGSDGNWYRLVEQNQLKQSFFGELAQEGYDIAWLFNERGYVYLTHENRGAAIVWREPRTGRMRFGTSGKLRDEVLPPQKEES